MGGLYFLYIFNMFSKGMNLELRCYWLIFTKNSKQYTCRILKKLSMYQIGRNFYNPSEPVEIPQHK